MSAKVVTSTRRYVKFVKAIQNVVWINLKICKEKEKKIQHESIKAYKNFQIKTNQTVI